MDLIFCEVKLIGLNDKVVVSEFVVEFEVVGCLGIEGEEGIEIVVELVFCVGL